MSSFPCLMRSSSAGEPRFALGDRLVDSYLAFVAGRARANTLRAVAHDLKTFFGVVGKDPAEVVAADVFDFLAHQRGDRTVVRISDGESGGVGPHDRPALVVDLGLLLVPGRPR
jgi:integrase/recombinase XerD